MPRRRYRKNSIDGGAIPVIILILIIAIYKYLYILLAAGILFAVYKIVKSKNPKPVKSTLVSDSNNYISKPYGGIKSILTKRELIFFKVLENVLIIRDDLSVTVKPRLRDLLTVRKSNNYEKNLYKVTNKHVDFLLCDRLNMKPRLVIELDDSSHNRPDRQQRDIFVNNVLRDVGIKVEHIKVRSSYDKAEILNLINRRVPIMQNSKIT